MSVAIWFTNDLRVDDNRVVEKALRQDGPVLGFFVRPPKQSPYQAQFLNESLEDLADQLHALNVPLLVFESFEFETIPTFLQEHNITHGYSAKALNSRKKSQLLALQKNTPNIGPLKRPLSLT